MLLIQLTVFNARNLWDPRMATRLLPKYLIHVSIRRLVRVTTGSAQRTWGITPVSRSASTIMSNTVFTPYKEKRINKTFLSVIERNNILQMFSSIYEGQPREMERWPHKKDRH